MFLRMDQNNSGGYFIKDDKNGIGENIIIECESIKEAESKFTEIALAYGNSFYNFCSCCGTRWPDFDYIDDSDLDDTPCVYGTPIHDIRDSWIRSGYIHYKSGKIEYFETKNNDD